MEAVEEIVYGMVNFKVDPGKELEVQEYGAFAHRVNLLLFKIQTAKRVLCDSDDGALYIYRSAPSTHDTRADRNKF